MRKKLSNYYLVLSALALIGAISLTLSSCGDDPVAPETQADFTSAADGFSFVTPTGFRIKFTSTSKNASAYSWDFGDGSALSTEESPTHLYSQAGTYSVKLSVAAAAGAAPATANKTTPVVVEDLIAALPNIVKGGGMESADASKWTVIYSGQKTVVGDVKTFNHVGYAFGSDTNKPSAGTEKCLNIFKGKTGEEVGSVFYQEVNLPAGTYMFSVNIKHEAEKRNGADNTALKEEWFEMFVGKVKPTFDETEPAGNNNGYNDNNPTGQLDADGNNIPAAVTGFFFNAWTGRAESTDYPATDGLAPKILAGRKARTRADENGVFTVLAANAGVHYVVFKSGTTGIGGLGTNGISIDNLRLVKLN